jgi:ATP-dependent helicase/nuclease subunit A
MSERGTAAGAPRLTAQQARSLEVRGASVALTSGAGCGKTTVLTSRFLASLEAAERQPLHAMAALTFTEKAARELRQRIRERCREKLKACENVPYWRSVLRALEAAPVGTFHEFCARWLRTHAVEAGLDPDFLILDAAIAGTIREQALAACVRRWLAAKHPDLIELAAEFSLRAVRTALGEFLDQRAADELARWNDRTEPEIVATWKSEWLTHERPALLGAIADALRKCAVFLAQSGIDHPKLLERLARLDECARDFSQKCETGGWLDALRELAKVPAGLRKQHWPSEQVNEEAKRQLGALRDAIDTLKKEATCWTEEASLVSAAHGLRFVRLALEARAAFDDAKRARGGLDFDDLLIKTRNLLRRLTTKGMADGTSEAESRNQPPLADGGRQTNAKRRKPSARPDSAAPPFEGGGASPSASSPPIAPRFILVDEFQDTDAVQGEILRLLSGTEFDRGRLFLVGDAKQSIYRFRGARPRIFQEFRGEFPESGRHELTENFRSVPGILNFVNALFGDAFPDDDQRLEPSPVTPAPSAEPAVEFLWAVESTGGDRTKVAVRDARRTEARWLARHLRNRLDAGWPVRDRRSGQLRNAEPNDIAILFRAMTDVGPYESALDDAGLDYHTIGGAAFYAQQEITDLVNVLSVIEDPLDEVSLAGALRSPFFCLSDDGLFWLASDPDRKLPDALRLVGGNASLSEGDRRAALRAQNLLDEWRSYKDRESIAALVNRVLDESGYEAALLGETLGGRKRANARKLVRMAREFDELGGFTLADFVAKLRDELREELREEQASTTDEEGTSVRLMSIHQSKGLEFPIVVVADLNRKSLMPSKTAAFDPDLGPIVRLTEDQTADSASRDDEQESGGDTLGYRIYVARERREDDAESLRLFYVAATRARDALILSSATAPTDKLNSAAMRLLDARFDRESGQLRVPLPEGWAQPQVRVIAEAPEPPRHGDKHARWRPSLAAVAATIERASPEPTAPRPVVRRPRYLDLDPARPLSPGAAQLDKLIRLIIGDPRSADLAELSPIARRAGRRVCPPAHPRTIDEAIALLRPWLEGRIGDDLRAAQTIERNLEWTISWPPDDEEPTVFHGRIDLAVQNEQGTWRIINFHLADAPANTEPLRLLLSARVLEAQDRSPVIRAGRIALGAESELVEKSRWDDAAIAACLAGLFAGAD